MNETILIKMLNYLGDACGFEYDDLKYAIGLTDIEIEHCKNLLEVYNADV